MHQKEKLNFEVVDYLVNSPLVEGDAWYLLDKSWYDMCKTYHTTGDPTSFPGPIDNSALLHPLPASNSSTNSTSSTTATGSTATTTSLSSATLTETNNSKSASQACSSNGSSSKFKSPTENTAGVKVNTQLLREDINEREHYIVVPEKCWNLLKKEYGIVDESHEIKRFVVEVSPGTLYVEIHYLKLKLCLYGGKEAIVEKSFSRKTTLDELQQEIRKIFNVNSDRETKLWINNEIFTFKPKENNELLPSKTENNVQPIKLPPTPPPMPSSNSSMSDKVSPISRIETRQTAKSIFKNNPPGDEMQEFSNQSISSTNSSTNNENQNKFTHSSTLLDVNINSVFCVTLEVINADGTWPSFKPRFGTVSTRSSKAQPGLCGLSNMGNTCFMNAALQCLSNTPPLTDYILSNKYVDDINANNPLGMHGEIARTYAELIKVMWSGNNTSFLPREFKCAVSRFAPQFNGFAQQDCQELMAFLLDGLHEDLNRIRNKPYIEIKNEVERRPDEFVAEESWSNYKRRNDSIVVDTFHAMLKSTLVCPGCKLVSVTFDPFCYLSLPLPVKREKQVNLTFLHAPDKFDNFDDLVGLEPNEVEVIRHYSGSISSFNGVVEQKNGSSDSRKRPMTCRIQVPRSGPVMEICYIVSRVISEELQSSSGKGFKEVKQEDLVVAELSSDGRVCKVYESNEHYNQLGDDIVVVEKKSNFLIPLYIRERKNKNTNTGSVITKPLFLHVPDLKFDTLYKSVIASLSNLSAISPGKLHYSLKEDNEERDLITTSTWYKLTPPTEEDFLKDTDNDQMDCEDENPNVVGDSADEDNYEKMDTSADLKTNGRTHKKCNRSSLGIPFYLCTVNSFGNHVIETLKPNTECDYSSKLYLGATFTITSSTSLQPQFAHIRGEPTYHMVESITPKVTPRPTLQLKDCISQFTNVERLGADDPWYCPKCKKHQQATKKFDIWSLPKVLIIHLKRFSFSRSWRDKIDTMVEFPIERLDMSEYVLNPKQKKQNQIYNLIGVSNHFGGLGGGHYTAYAKNAVQDAWYSFDDALVTQTSSSNVLTRSAYVLFYQLQEDASV